MDFGKAFESVVREDLWFKMRIMTVSENIINRIRKLYEGTKFCVNYPDNKVANFALRTRGVELGCSLSSHFCNILISDIIRVEYIIIHETRHL